MKKTYRFFGMVCLFGAMAMMATSCQKSEETTKATIALPQFEEAIGEPEEGDKAYIDFNASNVFKWNGSDEIMVYNLDAEDGTNTLKAIYSTDASAEGQTYAEFTGDDLGSKKDHFFVFYPVSKIENGTGALDKDNYETFCDYTSQQYTLVDGNPTVDPNSLAMACEVNKLSGTFTLKHIYGVCRLRLKGTKAVESIQVTDNTYGLMGTVTMKLHEVNMSTFSSLMSEYTLANLEGTFLQHWNEYRQTLGYSSVRESDTHVLNCGDGVQLNETTATPFYLSIRPGAFINGFQIKVYYTDNTYDIINNYINPKDSYRIRAGVITGFSPAQVLSGEYSL